MVETRILINYEHLKMILKLIVIEKENKKNILNFQKKQIGDGLRMDKTLSNEERKKEIRIF